MLVEVSRRLCAFAFYVIRTCLLRVSAVLWIIYFLVLRSFHLFSPFRFFLSLCLSLSLLTNISHRCFSYYVYSLITSYSMVSVCVSLSLSLSLSPLFFLVLAIDSGLMSPLLNRLPSFTVAQREFYFSRCMPT